MELFQVGLLPLALSSFSHTAQDLLPLEAFGVACTCSKHLRTKIMLGIVMFSCLENILWQVELLFSFACLLASWSA